ncbi:hypothetical protein [Pseudoxanthomonas indica]|uniref:hypothetical protein n=1 Tax=Pseudoxanthomonas indica TaxID=428993 RepID=UPI0009A6D392|nr:hypothetical protein [Pseudoxanthomonas indica]
MIRSILGIIVGVLLVAVCWQLSALITAPPGQALGMGGLLMLGLLGTGWLGLMLVATCVLLRRPDQAWRP